jgi:hypothetical protein
MDCKDDSSSPPSYSSIIYLILNEDTIETSFSPSNSIQITSPSFRTCTPWFKHASYLSE